MIAIQGNLLEFRSRALYLNTFFQFFLFCVVPPGPGCGGESGVTDARKVVQQLDPEVVEKFRKLGVKYRQYLPDRTNAHYVHWQGVSITSKICKGPIT
jgi:hypothetical protein